MNAHCNVDVLKVGECFCKYLNHVFIYNDDFMKRNHRYETCVYLGECDTNLYGTLMLLSLVNAFRSRISVKKKTLSRL